MSDSEIHSISKIRGYLTSEFLLVDYNFALLPVFFGMVGVFYFLNKTNSGPVKVIYNLLLIVYSVNILFSGSRRGLFVLFVIIIILLVTQIMTLLTKNNFFKKLSSNSNYFLLSIIFLTFISYAFIFHTSYSFKYKTLEFINVKNLSLTKEKITRTVFSYILPLRKNITYSDIHNIIWSYSFDSKDPDSGWGTRNHKTVFPLTGDNVEIVPKGAKGYYMDRTCNSNSWNNNAYSFTQIANDSLVIGEIFYASVYCYVSSDFNGSWARISAEGAVSGLRFDSYDINRKGTWQKLSFTSHSRGGDVNIYLYFSKFNELDFSNLKGHVIFTYPIYKKVLFDSKDPETWGTRRSKIISDIPIRELGLPELTKGYLMDSTCNAHTWNGNAYSYTSVGRYDVNKNDSISASVFCYVSQNFNGDWVRLSCEGETLGNRIAEYNLQNKNTWQKLNINVKCKEGEARVYLYFSKYGVTDFSSLKGYVIYAYPQYKVIEKDSLQSYFNPAKIKIQKKSFQNIIAKKKIAKTMFDSSQINSYRLKIINKSLNIADQSLTLNSATKITKYYQSGILNFSLPQLLSTVSKQIDPDPIRNWVAKLVSEDTTYHAYTANIVTDSISDNFIATRTVRWQFAWQIFTKEYNWVRKLFGGGFAHLNWYGYYFYEDKTRSDWPHNPFISILLYSGIFGLLIYIFFMYKVVYYYLRYFKEYKILFSYFILTFFFSFFSGGSPFDPPIMGFFVMVPFFIHSLHKKGKNRLNQ